ncbi:MAG: DUF2974 domain-containing protein [Coriobacteriia bacterium]|nr:DUF2974 domain-containing protein [Coriobacteriia bacterium]
MRSIIKAVDKGDTGGMGNLSTYLAQYGDVPFSQAGFNEVDNLVLSYLSYVELDGIVPPLGSAEAVTVREAAAAFFAHHGEDELRASRSLNKKAPFLLRDMARSARFCDARLSCYVSQLDREPRMQFTALLVETGDAVRYVAFRGTGDELVSWWEDVGLSFKTIPAQTAALRYLAAVLDGDPRPVCLGGHSKGGNLAVYAATACDDTLRSRITAVYDNDGPGLSAELTGSPQYAAIRPLIRRIVPQYCVVGMLFEHDVACEIVRSGAKGLMQHDCMTWEVEGSGFRRAPRLSRRSVYLGRVLQDWIGHTTTEQKVQLAELLIAACDERALTQVADVMELGLSGLLKTIGWRQLLARSNRKTLAALLGSIPRAAVTRTRRATSSS